MEALSGLTTISNAIGLSLAPSFLLVGIGAILSVLTNRLGRIVDRARVLEADFLGAGDRGDPAMLGELAELDRRMASAHWAISLCTASEPVNLSTGRSRAERFEGVRRLALV